MPIATAVANLSAKAEQCDSLIVSVHRLDGAGEEIFSQLDREQITVAAFLNLFVAWEEFLEATFSNFLVGESTLSGGAPIAYASPPDVELAKRMLIGTNRYFDYANHELVGKMASIYFKDGYPFKQTLDIMASDFADLRTMRNASAHLSSTTSQGLKSLAQRIFGAPQTDITLYELLTALDPRSVTGNTVFAEARDKLLTAASLIAQG
ncbi:hypothetical protein FPL03_20460 [Xanthomonas citri pv. glycines]|uniref:hypothetical protein n=1 Tax=Xanthomonas citri TaxID=346 RepID=UPI0011886B85|nr:hypothetical protein [Xanthomonas citri]QDS13197.1 hypothetical protein FPL03_20460 [Xanthomonas citri pv. glycines]